MIDQRARIEDRISMDSVHEARVAFCVNQPAGNLVEPEVRMLLERLTRGPEGVIDLTDQESGARLVAALLERVESASNAAALVPLATTGDTAALGPLLGRAVDHAVALARTGTRRVLHVMVPPKIAELGPLLADRGFTVAYDVYGMETIDAAMKPAPSPGKLRFVDWSPGITPEVVHALIARAFEGAPGFLMLPLDDLSARLRSVEPPFRLLMDGEQIAGLCRVQGPDAEGLGSILLVARDPGRRRGGLGDILVSEAQRILASRGAKRFALEVTTDNTHALDLYKRHGFQPMSIETTWQMPLNIS